MAAALTFMVLVVSQLRSERELLLSNLLTAAAEVVELVKLQQYLKSLNVITIIAENAIYISLLSSSSSSSLHIIDCTINTKNSRVSNYSVDDDCLSCFPFSACNAVTITMLSWIQATQQYREKKTMKKQRWLARKNFLLPFVYSSLRR